MWVAHVADEYVLGLNFLEQKHCQVDLKERFSTYIGDEEVQ